MLTPIICLDFDGTLVDKQGYIHPQDVEILSAPGDAIFVPATGRPLHSVRKVFARNGLFTGQPIPLPLILDNGAHCLLV